MGTLYSVADLGAAVKEERRRQGYTQTELADLCGVGITYVSNLENGKETAELGKALKIIRMLGFDVTLNRRGA